MLALPRNKEVEMRYLLIGVLVVSYLLAMGLTLLFAYIADAIRHVVAIVFIVIVMMGMTLGLGWVGHTTVMSQQEVWSHGLALVVYAVCGAGMGALLWRLYRYPDRFHQHWNVVTTMGIGFAALAPFTEWLAAFR